jgi:preprotein translocase subunit SecG
MSAYSFLRNLCTSVSVVIGSVLIQHSLAGGSLTSLHGAQDEHGKSVDTSEKDYMKGLRTMWTFYTAMCGLMLVSAFFIKQKRTTPKTEEAGENGVTENFSSKGEVEEKPDSK